MKLNNKFAVCPIIFISDTKHTKLISNIRKGTYEVSISEPTDEDIMELLMKICYYEKIRLRNRDVAKEIINYTQHDFRRLCIVLQDLVNESKRE